MRGPPNPGTNGAEDEDARRWVGVLRSGSPDEKARARRRLAEIFEARGNALEAVNLLVTNAREGYRDAELFQALTRLYRQLGDEYLAASAALEATRLNSYQPSNDRPARHSPIPYAGRRPRHPPDGPLYRPDPATPSPRRVPLRIAGWLAVVATAVAAAAVLAQSPASAALYVGSAAALGLLLVGSGSARRLLRLPDGPLGDGALLFVWLLALLAAGALLPRPLTILEPSEHPADLSTPGPVTTPSPSPSPPVSSGAGHATPTTSPTP